MFQLLLAQVPEATTTLSAFIESYDGVAMLTSLGLVIALLILLRGNERKLVRGPFLAWCLYLFFLALDHLLPKTPDLTFPADDFALFFLLCSLGRSLFLLTVHTPPGKQLLETWPKIFLDVVQGVIYLGALLITLQTAGVDPGSLVTGSALVTAALGFSMRDTLGNLFAGLAIHAEHPFSVGDWIQFDEQRHHIGEVLEINWRATKVLTLDKVEVIVPNGQLALAPIRNFTRPTRYSRRSIYVVAPYDVPTQTVHRLIYQALENSFGVLREPPPSVVTNEFNERGVEYWVRFFTEKFHMRDGVDGAARDRIWYAFQRHGIEIPGPIRKVQLQELNKETEAEDAISDLAERKAALQQIDFLDELPEGAFDTLALRSRKQLFAPGEVIIQQGTLGDELFIVHHGEVAINIAHGGETVEVGRMGPGKFFGELSLMTGQPRSATVTAASDCELYVVNKVAFAPILSATPELAQHISQVLAERQSQLEQHSERVTRKSHREPADTRDLLDRIRNFFSLGN